MHAMCVVEVLKVREGGGLLLLLLLYDVPVACAQSLRFVACIPAALSTCGTYVNGACNSCCCRCFAPSVPLAVPVFASHLLLVCPVPQHMALGSTRVCGLTWPSGPRAGWGILGTWTEHLPGKTGLKGADIRSWIPVISKICGWPAREQLAVFHSFVEHNVLRRLQRGWSNAAHSFGFP